MCCRAFLVLATVAVSISTTAQKKPIQAQESGSAAKRSDQCRSKPHAGKYEGAEGQHGGESLIQRYTKQLDSQEDRLARLCAEIMDLQKQRDSAQAELGSMILDVNVDEHFQN